MTELGYIRVSTTAQDHSVQRAARPGAGIQPEHIYMDKISGVRTKRPGLDALLSYARSGDTITVLRLDRLGRSLAHIVTTSNKLGDHDIAARSLTEGIDMSTASGKAVAHLTRLMAEYERDPFRERLAESRASHEAKGGK